MDLRRFVEPFQTLLGIVPDWSEDKIDRKRKDREEPALVRAPNKRIISNPPKFTKHEKDLIEIVNYLKINAIIQCVVRTFAFYKLNKQLGNTLPGDQFTPPDLAGMKSNMEDLYNYHLKEGANSIEAFLDTTDEMFVKDIVMIARNVVFRGGIDVLKNLIFPLNVRLFLGISDKHGEQLGPNDSYAYDNQNLINVFYAAVNVFRIPDQGDDAGEAPPSPHRSPSPPNLGGVVRNEPAAEDQGNNNDGGSEGTNSDGEGEGEDGDDAESGVPWDELESLMNHDYKANTPFNGLVKRVLSCKSGHAFNAVLGHDDMAMAETYVIKDAMLQVIYREYFSRPFTTLKFFLRMFAWLSSEKYLLEVFKAKFYTGSFGNFENNDPAFNYLKDTKYQEGIPGDWNKDYRAYKQMALNGEKCVNAIIRTNLWLDGRVLGPDHLIDALHKLSPADAQVAPRLRR